MDSLNVEKVSTDDEIGKILKETVLNEFCHEYVLIGEDRTCMTGQYVQIAEQIKNFEVLDDDIWVITYPKTGTTWTQEMVWMVVNDLDFEGGKERLPVRFPFLELSGLFDEKKMYTAMKLDTGEYNFNSVNTAANQKKRPRFIKCHLPFSLLPDQIKNGIKKPKIVYVVRNPKDVCVSMCHHGNLLQAWKADVESFAKIFMANKTMYGSFWKHVFGFWEHREAPNILFLKFEDMKEDLPSVIRNVAKFFQKKLTNEQVEVLSNHLSFESIKKNDAVNNEYYFQYLKENNLVKKDGAFIRAGKVGKYKEELSPETVKEMDAWIKENVAGTILEKEDIFYL